MKLPFGRRPAHAPSAAPSPPGPPAAAPSTPASPESNLAAADRAAAAGNLAGAASALRGYLAAVPHDGRAALRLGRTLAEAGDAASARRVLEPLEGDPALGSEATARLAELDEREGAADSAALRWERLLADDIDHPQARARLAELRPAAAPEPLESAAPTFVGPDGASALRYRLLRELGRGATATVYLARDATLGLDLALKMLHPHLAGSARSDARRRFFAEARTAAALRHPGVVAIYDLDDATRTLTMEYLPGGTLRARLRQGPPSAGEAHELARGLLGALAYVHERGVVHGDLKPSNILLRRPGEAVLADFGIAHLTERHDSLEGPAGTPLYLAPEQFAGAPSSPFSDLFAAGAILWELVAGESLRLPGDLAARRLGGRPLPAAARTRLGAAAEEWEELCALLLVTDPGRRLPSAGAALAVLR